MKGTACVDFDVEILTRDGWGSYTDLAAGGRVTVAQFSDGKTLWGDLYAVHVYPLKIATASMDIDGEVVHLTPNHRVLTSRGIVRAEYLIGHEAKVPSPGGLTTASFGRTYDAGMGVWCPETANGTWLARKNGQEFFTGNSMEEFRRQLGERIPNAIPRDTETERSTDLWDAGAEARYQDEQRQLARDDETRSKTPVLDKMKEEFYRNNPELPRESLHDAMERTLGLLEPGLVPKREPAP